ncbi:MAG: PAS domain S-box protein [Desulfobacteraceae bacterium]|jgi:PAS domain S-box-containing protein
MNYIEPSIEIQTFLERHRNAIIAEWVHRLKTQVGVKYAERPIEELMGTVSQAYDNNCHVLLRSDHSHMDQFIEKITRLRLDAGFSLSHVQKAFELFREIILPMLFSAFTFDQFYDAAIRVNQCMAYTIHQFSDHFQAMHEKMIRKHNLQLKWEVKRRTAELAESERKYKTLVEEINDGYVVVQGEYIVFANPAFAKLHGWSTETVIGAKFYDFVAPQSRKKIIAIYNRGMILGKHVTPKPIEYMRLTVSGNSYPTEILARITYYDNQLSTIAICRDITERVRMEKKIREAERMATIGQITTSLSHEIRNPLSTIKLNLQVIKKNAILKGNDERRIDISVREVKRLERILKDLLDFAKPLSLKLKPVDICAHIQGYTELLDERFKEKSIQLRFDYQSTMPLIPVDTEKFQQAVMNLLFNAIDASPQSGTIYITIDIAWRNARRFAAVRIQDEGTGIPKALLEEIRKPFFTTKTRGTGLGLTNTERVARDHGGWLEIDDKLPFGAAFTLMMPVGE